MVLSLDANSYVNPLEILDTTVSTSSDGCLMIYGGLSIFNTSSALSLTHGGGITLLGGLSVGLNSLLGGNTHILSTSNSNNPTSGALIINGGIGVLKDVFVGNLINTINLQSSSVTTNNLLSTNGDFTNITTNNLYVEGNVIKGEKFIYNISIDNTYNTSYTTVSRFKYSGTLFHTINNIQCIICIENNNISDLSNPDFYYTFRIYDRTNVNIIATSNNLSNTLPSVQNLTVISNVPTVDSIFELQILTGTNAIGRRINVNSIEINTITL